LYSHWFTCFVVSVNSVFHAVHSVLWFVSAAGKLCAESRARCKPVNMTTGQMQLAGCSLLTHITSAKEVMQELAFLRLLESSHTNCRLDFHKNSVVEVALDKLVPVNFGSHPELDPPWQSSLFCAVCVPLYNYYVSETVWTLQIMTETV